jgi:hypothetical protein
MLAPLVPLSGTRGSPISLLSVSNPGAWGSCGAGVGQHGGLTKIYFCLPCFCFGFCHCFTWFRSVRWVMCMCLFVCGITTTSQERTAAGWHERERSLRVNGLTARVAIGFVAKDAFTFGLDGTSRGGHWSGNKVRRWCEVSLPNRTAKLPRLLGDEKRRTRMNRPRARATSVSASGWRSDWMSPAATSGVSTSCKATTACGHWPTALWMEEDREEDALGEP